MSAGVRKLDYVVITWLLTKLMLDTPVVIYFVHNFNMKKNLAYAVVCWLITKLILDVGAFIYFIWRVFHHGQHGIIQQATES